MASGRSPGDPWPDTLSAGVPGAAPSWVTVGHTTLPSGLTWLIGQVWATAPSRPLWEPPTWTHPGGRRPFQRLHRQVALRAGLRWTDRRPGASGRPRTSGSRPHRRGVWVAGPRQPQRQGGAVGERGPGAHVRGPDPPCEAPGPVGTERSHRGLTGVTEPPGGTPARAQPLRVCGPPDLCPGPRTGGPGS